LKTNNSILKNAGEIIAPQVVSHKGKYLFLKYKLSNFNQKGDKNEQAKY